MKNEVWKPIKGFEGLYEVSTLGRIKSCEKVIISKDGKVKHYKERILKPSSGKYGRNQYTLSKNGKKYPIRGYRIVAETFLENPFNLPEINHKDGNNLNDELDNLEWVTFQENTNHALKHNLFNTYYKRFKGEIYYDEGKF